VTAPVPEDGGSGAAVDAGPFADWLHAMRAALAGDGGTDVPCGDCRGCCVSGYPVPIRAQDAPMRAAIPAANLVASGGREFMTARADGTCPMLVERECSVYARRPQTCRDYDCRIFAAAGLDAGGPARSVINGRVRAWRFRYRDDAERALHGAVRAAAAFLATKGDRFPFGTAPTSPSGIAVTAVTVVDLFLAPDAAARDDAATVAAILARLQRPSNR
jgi:uncharacterized protein